MKNPITRTIASQMLSLFDYAFKRGVLDAAEMRDDYFCDDFIRRREKPSSYGILDSPYDMDWREWKFTINRWCAKGKLRQLYYSFIDKINRPGYLMVILPLVQDFYVMGIKEWREYSNPVPLEIFRSQSRVHWKPIDGKSMSRISNNQFVSYAQGFAYNRAHKAADGSDVLSSKSYELFSIELWRATRPIPKITIDDDF